MTATDFTLDLSDIHSTTTRDAALDRLFESDRCRADYADRLPPVLAAEPLPCGCCVKVWCRYCGRFHRHGKPTDDGTRHRVAHCAAETSYTASGYILHVVEPGTYDAETMRRLKGGRR